MRKSPRQGKKKVHDDLGYEEKSETGAASKAGEGTKRRINKGPQSQVRSSKLTLLLLAQLNVRGLRMWPRRDASLLSKEPTDYESKLVELADTCS